MLPLLVIGSLSRAWLALPSHTESQWECSSSFVQRGGALSYLHGYEQALRKLRVTEGVVAAKNAAAGKRGEELLDDENGEDAASAA